MKRFSVEQAIHPSKKRIAFKDQFRRCRHTLVVFSNDGGNMTVMGRYGIPNLSKYGSDVLSNRHERLPQDTGGSTSLSQPPPPRAGPLLVMIPTWKSDANNTSLGKIIRSPPDLSDGLTTFRSLPLAQLPQFRPENILGSVP